MGIKPEDLIAKFQYALDNNWGYIIGKSGGVWTQKAQNAATDEMAKKYGQRWVGHRVADCSGLFAWAFKQLGGKMYHGSNTMWLKWCTAKGVLDTAAKKLSSRAQPCLRCETNPIITMSDSISEMVKSSKIKVPRTASLKVN